MNNCSIILSVSYVKKIVGAGPVSRRDKARATRLAIIHAAQTEFAQNGYHATPMAAIASRAGVAVQTVHFVFHTKGELLGAVVDNAVLGEEAPEPPEHSDWYRAVMVEPDAQVALRAFVLASAAVFIRASAMNDVARAAATTDPDARATFERLEQLRAGSYRDILEAIASKGRFKDGVDLDDATDIMMAFLSPRTFLSLTQDRGWTPERTMGWIAEALPAMILGS